MLSIKKIILTTLIYYFLVLLFPIVKVVLKILVSKKLLKDRLKIEKTLDIFFRFFAYHGPLKMDMERYIEVGFLREQLMKELGHWKIQRQLDYSDNLKIGFLGVLGKEGILSKEFFVNPSKNVEVFMYDMDQESKIFNGNENINYKKTPKLKHYLRCMKKQYELLQILEKDNLDVLIVLSNTYSLPVFDLSTIPVLLSINTTSTVLPHPKFKVQIYVQPGWNYKINHNHIKNIKRDQDLNFPLISNNFIFASRATKAFIPKNINERKNTFYFAGGLEKIDTKIFLETIAYLLENKKDSKFIYFGGYYRNELSIIETFFKNKGLLNKTYYGGSYKTYFDENEKLIDDGIVYNAYGELFDSRLFVNSFPIIGARSCVEAYFAQVPVIQLDLDEDVWIKNQKLQPFKLPIMLTKTGTVNSVEEYKEKCLKVLNDDSFAQQIIDEQNELLKKITNTEYFWFKLLEMTQMDIKLKKEESIEDQI